MRASLPRGDATWPAFWMLGVDRTAVGWPASGEIDVLEHVGRRGDEVHGAVHGPGYSGGAAIVGSTVVDDVTSFHAYAVEWTADAIEWSVDGRPYHRVDRDDVPSWPFDRPFHLVVNLAIGGTLGGEPTSVGITDRYALVSVDTSAGNFVAPSGTLFVIDLVTRATVRTIDLGGQPDAVDISPDGKYATVVIENQRNEDINGALIPQLPAGTVVVVDIKGAPATWTTKLVDLTNLPGMYAPTDPEPEYIDINSRNQAVVSLQENNHLAIIDLRTAKVINSFSAGTVDLVNVDAVEE
eukprot:gene21128-41092_t